METSDQSPHPIHYDSSVAQAALASLEPSLEKVAIYIELAANRAEEDLEFVHQLRIATRQTLAALKIYGEFLPRPEVKWFRKRLTKIRQAAGAARDLDVLLQRYKAADGGSAKKFRKRLRRERAAAQPAIAKLHDKLFRSGKFAKHRTALVEAVRQDSDRKLADRFGDLARQRLESAVEAFFESMPKGMKKLRALHRFRIRGKRLRYTMELIAPAFPPSFQQELLPRVKQLLDQLGKINDHAVSCARFEHWLENCPKRKRAFLKLQRKKARGKLKQALERLRATWTAESAFQLQVEFAKYIETNSSGSVDALTA